MLARGTPFLLSYAHADGKSSQRGTARLSDHVAELLFYELTENLGQLLALPTGTDYGFLDREMQGGTRWFPRLARALGSCQVLVALVSVPYLSSEWCGKEWHAFDQRHPPESLPGAQGTDQQGCIVPVRWAPVESALPPAVSDDMFFTPKGSGDADLPELYRENGVFGLYKIGREDALPKIGWDLSLLIARIYKSLHLEHREFAQGDLKNMFEGWRP